MAIGAPGNGIVSLGDGGEAILSFERFIENGPGWDFAIFENSGYMNFELILNLVGLTIDK